MGGEGQQDVHEGGKEAGGGGRSYREVTRWGEKGVRG